MAYVAIFGHLLTTLFAALSNEKGYHFDLRNHRIPVYYHAFFCYTPQVQEPPATAKQALAQPPPKKNKSPPYGRLEQRTRKIRFEVEIGGLGKT